MFPNEALRSSPGTARAGRQLRIPSHVWRYFGDLPLSLQFTFEVSPFFGHFCFCDCCSFAPRDVSFCPLVGWLGELLELAGEVAEDGDEVVGVLWACTAPKRITEVIPKMAVMT